MNNQPINTQINMNEIYQEAQNAQSSSRSSDGVNYLMLKEGVTSVRFLPVPANKEFTRALPYYKTTKHFITGSNGKLTSVTCSTEKHGSCPICEEWGRLSNMGDKERAGAIRPQVRYVYTVLNKEQQVCILDMDFKPHEAFLSILATYMKRNPSFNPFDLNAGYWFDIEKRKDPNSRGKFQKNIWTIVMALQPSSVPAELIANFGTAYIFPEKLYKTYLPEELDAAMNGDWAFLEKYKDKNVADSTTQNDVRQNNAPQPQQQPVVQTTRVTQQSYQQPQSRPQPQYQYNNPPQAVDNIDSEIDSILDDR